MASFRVDGTRTRPAIDENTKPYNIGIPLWTHILLPIVMWALYVVARSEKAAQNELKEYR